MKQLTALIMAFLLVFASCQKPNDLATGKDISYTQADFVDTEAIGVGAEKADDRKSDLKVVIRKVSNAVNTYRLVLKVDSVQLNSVVPTDNPTFQPITGQDNVISAGLTIPDPTNPDLDQSIIIKGQLVFRKQSENGYFVYVSDPFETTVKFDYELVTVDYNLKVTNNSFPIEINEERDFFILPNGKTVEQAPEVARLKPPRLNLLAGSKTVRVGSVISNDPAGQITKMLFKGNLTATDVNQKQVTLQVQMDLVKTVNSAIGVSAWGYEGCLNYYDETTKQWKCEGDLSGKLSSIGILSGTLYLLDNRGITATIHQIDDWQGETGDF